MPIRNFIITENEFVFSTIILNEVDSKYLGLIMSHNMEH